jgi:hypothetical protein
MFNREQGTRCEYEFNPAAFASLREYFDEFWAAALQAIAKRVEQQSKHENDRP